MSPATHRLTSGKLYGARGQTVALVGRSGSGKTTAMHLLFAFLGC